MIDYRKNPRYWQASFQATQLSKVRIITHAIYKLDAGSTLTMTKANGESVTYDLYSGEHFVDNSATIQEISFPLVDDEVSQTPTVSADTSTSPAAPKYEIIRFQGDFARYITLIEVQVYDKNGVYINPTKFTFQSTEPMSHLYTAKEAMNGNTATGSHVNGATIRPGTSSAPNYWQATYPGGIEISKIVLHYYNQATYLTFLGASQLKLIDVNNNEWSFSLAEEPVQTITLD